MTQLINLSFYPALGTLRTCGLGVPAAEGGGIALPVYYTKQTVDNEHKFALTLLCHHLRLPQQHFLTPKTGKFLPVHIQTCIQICI